MFVIRRGEDVTCMMERGERGQKKKFHKDTLCVSMCVCVSVYVPTLMHDKSHKSKKDKDKSIKASKQ